MYFVPLSWTGACHRLSGIPPSGRILFSSAFGGRKLKSSLYPVRDRKPKVSSRGLHEMELFCSKDLPGVYKIIIYSLNVSSSLRSARRTDAPPRQGSTMALGGTPPRRGIIGVSPRRFIKNRPRSVAAQAGSRRAGIQFLTLRQNRGKLKFLAMVFSNSGFLISR